MDEDEKGLGDLVRDTITGFEGVVTCVSRWLHGCSRLTVQPRELKDGKPIEAQSFDEPQLDLLERGIIGTTSNTGGPRPEPSTRQNVRR